MLEILGDLPSGIIGLKGTGMVTRKDNEQVLQPLFEQARREGGRLRLLYDLGPEFEGFTPGAAWEDAKLGMQSERLVEGCAIVSELVGIREVARIIGFLLPCPIQSFRYSEREKATAWLRALPERAVPLHYLISDLGVIVVEMAEPLRALDFDALTLTADAWIAGHGELQGLVIHAKAFPGWENLGTLVRHMRFIRDHHKRVSKVAISAETWMSGFVPKLTEHFVRASVMSFGYRDLENAIQWAGTREAVVHLDRVGGVLL
jgi:SpoIIAA-like